MAKIKERLEIFVYDRNDFYKVSFYFMFLSLRGFLYKESKIVRCVKSERTTHDPRGLRLLGRVLVPPTHPTRKVAHTRTLYVGTSELGRSILSGSRPLSVSSLSRETRFPLRADVWCPLLSEYSSLSGRKTHVSTENVNHICF